MGAIFDWYGRNHGGKQEVTDISPVNGCGRNLAVLNLILKNVN